jgi:hypothetical protein
VTSIFISHSSSDAEAAESLRRVLVDDGHRVFLDIDPEEGIAAGAKWEQTLYARLRACRAVVFLCTPSSLESMWCFAELTNARSLAKPIFPALSAPCDLAGSPFAILGDAQAVDLSTDHGRSRLRDALRALDGRFTWDGERPPYPGLRAFQEDDAALMFGRDADVQGGLDQLNGLRRRGGARLMLVLGASGSGKSSLVRAGLIPHLRADSPEWVVVSPFRPSEGLGDPGENLAAALAEAWRGLPGAEPPQALAETMAAPAAPHPLLRASRDLAVAAGHRDATVLVTIDQFEELLSQGREQDESPFVAWLCDAVRASQAVVACPLIVLATVRSDFLAGLQMSESLAGVETSEYLIKPIPRSGFGELIEGPANLVGLRLDPGLATKVVEDAATANALPLLAFTLAQLWDRFGDDGELTVAEYDALGGLAGSVQKVVAEELASAGFDARQEVALRRAFIPHLVQIDDDGRHRRRIAHRSELPSAALPILDRFVDARLLTREGDDYEVVHESLFNVWDKLAAWLTEDRELLTWERRVSGVASWWLDHDRDEGALLRGAQLAEAQRWAQARGDALAAPVLDLIRASTALREREDRERAEQAELLRKRALSAEARELTLAGEASIVRDPQLSLLLAVDAAKRSLEAEGTIIPVIDSLVRRTALATPRRVRLDVAGIETVAWHPRGRWLAAGSSDGTVLVIDTESGAVPYRLAEQEWIESVAWSDDGTWLAAGARDNSVTIWDPLSGARRPTVRGRDQVQYVDWLRGSSVIAIGWARGDASVVTAHDLDTGRDRFEVPGIRGAWSPDGSALAAGGGEGEVRFFTAEGRLLAELPGHDRYVHSVRWTRDGRRLATASVDDTVIVWDAVAHERAITLPASFSLGAAWMPDGSLLAASSGDRLVTVWDGASYDPLFTLTSADTITGDPIAGTGAEGYVVSIDWDPTGAWLAASDRGGFGADEGGAVHLLRTQMLRARTAPEWLAAAELHVERGLTEEELRRYPAPFSQVTSTGFRGSTSHDPA